MNCYINSIEINNYKSIKSTKVEPTEGLSVFIGKNGAGKTVFLTSIKLLQKLAFRAPFGQEYVIEEDKDFTSLQIKFSVNNLKIIFFAKFYEIEKEGDRNELKVIEEFVSIEGFKKNKKFEVPFHILLSFSGSDKFKFIHYYSPNRENKNFSKDYEDLKKFEKHFEQISHFIRGMKYYSATQYSTPGNSPSVIELDEKGRLSAHTYPSMLGYQHLVFLKDLYSLSINNPELWQLYKKTIGNTVLDLVDEISFSELDLPSFSYQVSKGGKIQKKESKRKIVAPVFTKGKHQLSPAKLSEGTFKTLALIFYIFTDQGSLLLVEEPEVCVHHGLLAKIIDIIKSYSYEKQIFVTTHSEVVLDSVESNNVYVIVWKDGSEVLDLYKFLGRKGTVGLKKYLKEEGNLGEYIKFKDILNE